jgi:hypothetical protein
MPSELISVLINSSGAVATCAMFLYFLVDLNKRQQSREKTRDESFIKAINATTTAVTNGMKQVGKQVEEVDHKVEQIHRDHKEDKEIIKSMYIHSKQMADALGKSGKVQVTVNQ